MRKRIGGLILAAGCSKRMGDFKPLMPLRGKTLIENTIDSRLLCGVSPITVVLGHRGRDIEAIVKSRYLGTGLTMPAATMFFATQRAAYAPERSTFVGSLPESAPPPMCATGPY